MRSSSSSTPSADAVAPRGSASSRSCRSFNGPGVTYDQRTASSWLRPTVTSAHSGPMALVLAEAQVDGTLVNAFRDPDRNGHGESVCKLEVGHPAAADRRCRLHDPTSPMPIVNQLVARCRWPLPIVAWWRSRWARAVLAAR